MNPRDKTVDTFLGRGRKRSDGLADGLDADLPRLPREIQPGRDLWPTIAVRLAPRAAAPKGRLRNRWAPLLAAAALLLAGVGIGFVLGGGRAFDTSESFDMAAQLVPAAALANDGLRSASMHGTVALTEYRIATAALRSDLAARAGQLNAETREVVQRDLALIEAAIAEIERAFAAAPTDPTLERLLLTRYRQQVDLLTRWLPIGGANEELGG